MKRIMEEEGQAVAVSAWYETHEPDMRMMQVRHGQQHIKPVKGEKVG
jgi:hypothetical protein